MRAAFARMIPWMLSLLLIAMMIPLQAPEASFAQDVDRSAEEVGEVAASEPLEPEEDEGQAAEPEAPSEPAPVDVDPAGADAEEAQVAEATASGKLGAYHSWTLVGDALVLERDSEPPESSPDADILTSGDSLGYLSHADEIGVVDIQGTIRTYRGGLFKGLKNLHEVRGLEKLRFEARSGAPGSADSLFEGCTSLEEVDLSGLDASAIDRATALFRGCSSVRSLDLSGFTSCASWFGAFKGCTSLESVKLPPFSGGDSSVNFMFEGCSSLKSVDMSAISITSNSLLDVFKGCAALEELRMFSFVGTRGPNGVDPFDMSGVFVGCSSLKSLDLSSFDTRCAWKGEVDTAVRKGMFDGALETVKLGEGFTLQPCLPGGPWYSTSGDAFAPADIPAGSTDTYSRNPPSASESVSIQPIAESFLAVGARYQLKADVQPASLAASIVWSSLDESVATVDATGMLSAVAPGHVTIMATAGSASDSIGVEVRSCVRRVTMGESSKTVHLSAGAFALQASVDPPDAYNAALAWQSADPSVATVDGTGMVTPLSVGTVSITASAGAFSDTCIVTVEDPISLTLSDIEKVLMIGSAPYQLICTIDPPSAAGAQLVWKTSNAGVASVDQAGRVTPVSAGEATVTVTTKGASAQCSIKVIERPEDIVDVASITLDPSQLQLVGAQSEQLSATVLPANATHKTVQWASSNPSIVKVDATGMATSVAKGSAAIIATSGDGKQSATCDVTVSNPASAFEVTPRAKAVAVGEAFNVGLHLAGQLPGAVDDVGAVTWSVSDEGVLAIEPSGEVARITAKAPGIADVRVSGNVGGHDLAGTARVSVTWPTPTVFSLDRHEAELVVGSDVLQLTASAMPAEALNAGVKWVASDPDIATVDASGIVRPVRAGRVTIRAALGSMSDSCTVIVHPLVLPSSPSSDVPGQVLVNDSESADALQGVRVVIRKSEKRSDARLLAALVRGQHVDASASMAEAYDIHLEDAFGARVEWDSSDVLLTVCIKLDDRLSAMAAEVALAVHYVDDAFSSAETKASQVSDGYIVFDTTHFSTYALTASSQDDGGGASGDHGEGEDASESEGGGLPRTGDDAVRRLMVLLALAIAAAAACGAAALRRSAP